MRPGQAIIALEARRLLLWDKTGEVQPASTWSHAPNQDWRSADAFERRLRFLDLYFVRFVPFPYHLIGGNPLLQHVYFCRSAAEKFRFTPHKPSSSPGLLGYPWGIFCSDGPPICS